MFTVTIVGTAAQATRINKLRGKLENLDLSPAVRKVAEVWRDNFDSEGGAVGGWRDLGPATQRVREFRGYDPEHPILVQSGSLRDAAIELPLNFSGRYAGRQLPGASSWIVNMKGKASLIISGEKVENQYGASGSVDDDSALFAPGPQSWSMPARRFWFINPAATSAAYEGALEEVEKAVRSI